MVAPPAAWSRAACAFKRLMQADIDAYLACGEGRGKAEWLCDQGRASAL
jgi:hypothetical protein